MSDSDSVSDNDNVDNDSDSDNDNYDNDNDNTIHAYIVSCGWNVSRRLSCYQIIMGVQSG